MAQIQEVSPQLQEFVNELTTQIQNLHLNPKLESADRMYMSSCLIYWNNLISRILVFYINHGISM